jgi:hypothetical protein
MSRIRHDQFSKQFIEALLTPMGTVEISHEILAESRFADLWFQPHLHINSPDHTNPPTKALGLLAVIVRSACLIEPFRNAVDSKAIQNCLAKRFALIATLGRQSATPLTLEAQPRLWILTPTISAKTLENFGVMPPVGDFPLGVHSLPPGLGTYIIALHQLPTTPETLWLRLLGKGRVQYQAIQEILALPTDNSLRDLALKSLVNWKIALESIPSELGPQEDLIMALTQAYVEWEQRTRQQGIEQGIEQVACKMLALGMSLEQIAEATGLAPAQIKQLQTHQNQSEIDS